MFKKLLVFLAASTISLMLFFTVVAASLVLTFTPTRIKGWLKTSNIYNTIVDDVLKQSQVINKSDNSADSTNPLNDPGIQAAATKALSPEFLQTTTEKIIDGTAPWLEGTATKPNFSIDLSNAKNNFADNIGAYETTRLAALPTCTGPTTQGSDVLSLQCKPAGYDGTADIQKLVDQLKNSSDFIKTTTLTPDTVSSGNDSSKQPLYEKFHQVPRYYQLAKLVPIITGGIALLDALVIVFLSADRRRGIRRVATSLYLTSASLAVEIWLSNIAIEAGQKALKKQATAGEGLQTTATALVRAIQSSLNSTVIIFAIAFMVIAVGLTIYLLVTKQPKKPAENDPKPSKAEGTKEPAEDESKQDGAAKADPEDAESAKKS